MGYIGYPPDALSSQSEDRTCATMIYSCSEGKKNSNSCKQMKRLVKDFKYKCNKKRSIYKRFFSCYSRRDNPVNRSLPDFLSVSWDYTNPLIFATCESPSAENARKCAYKKCLEKGGRNCKPVCDFNTGESLRACRLGVQTYVASDDYGRFGCGTRYIKAGHFTPETYAIRELNRCKRASKASNCMVRQQWK